MTMHKSLKVATSLKRARNVLTRAERIKILEEDGRWSEPKSVFGLPKVRQFVMKRRHKAAAKKEEAAVAAEGAEAAAAPAAEGAAAKPGAKPAAAKTAASGKPAAAAKPGAAAKPAPAKGAKGK